jgi:hypothetical protein
MISPYLLLMAMAILYVLIAIKRVAQDERLVIFKQGKPVSIAGPGLVIDWPFVQNGKILDLRSHSYSLPQVKFVGDERSSLVAGEFAFHIFDPLKAASVPNLRTKTEQALQSTLSSILANATIQECLIESFVLENQVAELVNKETKTWGVTVTALTFTQFPIHRKLTSQLAGMLDRLVVELAVTIENVAEKQETIELIGVRNNDDASEHSLEYKYGINV